MFGNSQGDFFDGEILMRRVFWIVSHEAFKDYAHFSLVDSFVLIFYSIGWRGDSLNAQ